MSDSHEDLIDYDVSSHSSFAIDTDLLYGSQRVPLSRQSSTSSYQTVKAHYDWFCWRCCCGKDKLGKGRLDKSALNDSFLEEVMNPTSTGHEIIYGAGEYHEVDPERRFVEELLRNNPSSFPPLCGSPSALMIGGTLAILIYVVLVVTLPSRVISVVPWPEENTPDDDDDDSRANWARMKLLAYASIPVVSCIFTYFHIWLALWMMFYPLEFIGICRIPHTNVGLPGWQGIVPFKSKKMIMIATHLILSRLMNVKEEFKKVRPKVLASILEAPFCECVEMILPQVIEEVRPDLWSLLPQAVKGAFIAQATDRCSSVTEKIFEEMQQRVEELVHIPRLIEIHFEKDKAAIGEMFIRCGYQELLFIRNSGAVLGFVFGFLQMLVWIFWHPETERTLHPALQSFVVFPVFGLVVGSLTNAISLKVIFEPVEPKYFCGVKMHGLFLRRQREVSALYGRLAGTEVLNAPRLMSAIVSGSTVGGTQTFDTIVRKHFDRAFDEIMQTSLLSSLGSLVLSDQDLNRMRDGTIEQLLDVMPDVMNRHDVISYVEGSVKLEQTLRDRMNNLPHYEFDGMLHPVFQEDEWKLVVVGGALGVVIGLLQSYFIN